MRHAPFALLVLCAKVAAAQRPVEVAPNAPPDRPFSPRAQCQWEAAVRAMAPYVAQARASYPAARQRFLRGLPPHHTFFVTTRLHDVRGRVEQVFVVVDSIRDGRIVGRIWSPILRVVGYVMGQRYEFPEEELLDWMVARPDGTEEGNVVGNFLDRYEPPACDSVPARRSWRRLDPKRRAGSRA